MMKKDRIITLKKFNRYLENNDFYKISRGMKKFYRSHVASSEDNIFRPTQRLSQKTNFQGDSLIIDKILQVNMRFEIGAQPG